MNVRRFLFLSLGLARGYSPEKAEYPRHTTEKLLEPDGARACRRNIIALAGVVVVAGLAGADPREISVFGVKPSGDRGVLVLGVAVILSHLYWFVLRYHHMKEDGVIEQDPALRHLSGHDAEYLKLAETRVLLLCGRGADLFANYAAIVLTCLSWFFVASWIMAR